MVDYLLNYVFGILGFIYFFSKKKSPTDIEQARPCIFAKQNMKKSLRTQKYK